MKTLHFYMEKTNNFLESQFLYKNSHSQILAEFEKFKNDLFLTESGNLRVPKYYIKALNGMFLTLTEKLRDQNTVYCYVIDGKLFTTFKKTVYSSFKGECHIPNYRENGKEDRLHELRKNNVEIESGFYYPNGKKYFLK